MKLIRKITLWFFVFVVFSFLLAYAAVRTNGKEALEANLSAALERPVTVGDVRFIFPMGLRADEVSIEGLLTADSMRGQFGVSGFFGKGMTFSTIALKNPQLSLQKLKDGEWKLGVEVDYEKLQKPKKFLFFSVDGSSAKKEEPTQQEASADKLRGLFIESLVITDGTLKYSDQSEEMPIAVELQDLDLRAFSIAYPLRPHNTRYNLSAKVVSEQLPYSDSKLESSGWINWKKRAMDAKIKLTEPNGSIGLNADITSEDNVLTGKGRFKLSHLMGPKGEGEKKEASFEDIFTKAINSSGLQARAECSFETKMDDFHLDKLSCKGKIGINQAGLKENLQEIGKKFEDLGKQLTESESAETPQENSVAE